MNKGTTLIEIIIYFGLLTIFLTSIVGVFTSALDLKLESETTSNLYQDERYIVSKLNYEIGQSATIDQFMANLSLVDGKLFYKNTSLNGLYTTVSNFSETKVGNLNGKYTVSISFDLNSTHVQTTLGTR